MNMCMNLTDNLHRKKGRRVSHYRVSPTYAFEIICIPSFRFFFLNPNVFGFECRVWTTIIIALYILLYLKIREIHVMVIFGIWLCWLFSDSYMIKIYIFELNDDYYNNLNSII